MIKECFGKVGEFRECFECNYMELCSWYYVVLQNEGCPLFGKGFDSGNEICRLCVEYFVGRECKRSLSRRGYNKK